MSGDQQWPSYEPADDPPRSTTEESPWGREPTVGPVPYGPPTSHHTPVQHLTASRAPGRRLAGVVTAIVAAAALGGLGAAVGAFSSDDEPSSGVDGTGTSQDDGAAPGPDTAPDTAPDVLSVDGYADLLAAVRERIGSTQAFEAVLYPAYAVVDLPVDDTSPRKEGLYWDGDLDDFGGKGTATGKRVDLADVDPALLVRLVTRVKRLVEEPTSWYVIVRGPSTVFDDDGTRITAYASNEFTETAYLATRLDGSLVRKYTG